MDTVDAKKVIDKKISIKKIGDKKISVGLHLTILLFLVSLFGVLFSRTLFHLGFHSLLLRSCTSLLASYLFFFALIKFWLDHIKGNHRVLHAVAEQSTFAKAPAVKDSKPFKWIEVPFHFQGELNLEGILLAVLISIFVWIGLQGPAILIDTAFELALSIGLIRASKKISDFNWVGSIFKRTVIPFLIIFGLSVAVLLVAEQTCPGRALFSQVVLQCWVNPH